MFDAKLAEKISHQQDRDRAQFFAGRVDEIERFRWAVEDCRGSPQANFLIFQGPPGCGKTSLAAQLETLYEDRCVFIKLTPASSATPEELSQKVNETILMRGATIPPALKRLGLVAAKLFAKGEFTEGIVQEIAQAKKANLAVVIHIDEAQAIPDHFFPLLQKLHIEGAGFPCVVLMTGLETIEQRLGNDNALSRLGLDSTKTLGALEIESCAASTRQLIDQVGADGPTAEITQTVAGLAKEWPAHLHGAQRALCEELLRTHGDLSAVSAKTLRERSTALRHQYYEKRINRHPLDLDEKVTKRIISAVAKSPAGNKAHLGEIVYKNIKEHAPQTLGGAGLTLEHVIPVTNALISKGIVSKNQHKAYKLAIPSMGRWASNGVRPTERKR